MTFRPSQPRKRQRWLALAVMATVLSVLGGNAAFAVHNEGLFELDISNSAAICAPLPAPCGDANVADDAAPGDDWATLFAGPGGSFAKTFIPDPVSSAENSFYTGGGSKDVRDIPAWQYGTTNDVIPDKDDIADAFAAAYNATDGDTIIYFGMDRYDNNGDAEAGFWFFEDVVSLGPNGQFNGIHTVGDVLVLANWGGSNPVGEITVYEWVGGKNPLSLVFDNTAADCATADTNDNVCAVVNRQNVDPPWDFIDKGSSSVIRPLELFEAGINLEGLFGEERCFASFLASTRSSHSTTAQLKDFALDTFEQCGAELRTEVSDDELILGESVTDDAIITVSGTSTPPAPEGIVTFTVNGVLHDTVDLSTAIQNGNEYTVTSDPFTPTETGDYCFSASWPGDDNYTGGPFVDDGTNECFTVIELQPEIDTAQSFFPNDEATITVAAGGGNLDGTVDFQLFDNADCTGTPLYEELSVDVSGGLSVTVNTTNTSVAVDETIDLWWLVTYTSDIDVHNDAISDCVENSSLTIDNG